MTTWRYIVHLITPAKDGGGKISLHRPFGTGLDSRKDGLEGLPKALDSKVGEFGADVIAVSLQESASDAAVKEFSEDWEEVGRVEA